MGEPRRNSAAARASGATLQSDVALAARILPEERDPIPVLNGTVEAVGDAQDGVVHQDLDVLRQVMARRVLEDFPERGVPIAQPQENSPHRGAGSNGLVEHLPPRPISADELRHPGDGLHGDMGHRRMRTPGGYPECGMPLNHGRVCLSRRAEIGF